MSNQNSAELPFIQIILQAPFYAMDAHSINLKSNAVFPNQLSISACVNF